MIEYSFQRKAQGISLLEVLVAFSILAIALSTILSIFATGLRSASNSVAYTEAIINAENILAQSGNKSRLVIGEQSGKIDERYHWHRIVKPFHWNYAALAKASIKALAYEVEVEVFWEEGRHRRSVSLNSIRLIPEIERIE